MIDAIFYVYKNCLKEGEDLKSHANSNDYQIYYKIINIFSFEQGSYLPPVHRQTELYIFSNLQKLKSFAIQFQKEQEGLKSYTVSVSKLNLALESSLNLLEFKKKLAEFSDALLLSSNQSIIQKIKSYI